MSLSPSTDRTELFTFQDSISLYIIELLLTKSWYKVVADIFSLAELAKRIVQVKIVQATFVFNVDPIDTAYCMHLDSEPERARVNACVYTVQILSICIDGWCTIYAYSSTVQYKVHYSL